MFFAGQVLSGGRFGTLPDSGLRVEPFFGMKMVPTTLIHPISRLERVWLAGAEAPMARPDLGGYHIRPAARDRWLGATARSYTPDKIESVLRGTMSGNLTAQGDLFHLMRETWPRLMKDLAELEDGVLAMDWTVQPWADEGEHPTETALERARLVTRALWTMRPDPAVDESSFEGTIRSILSAYGRGIAVVEVDWEKRAVGLNGELVAAPRATRWVHPRYYGYPNSGEDRLMLNAREIGLANAGNNPAQRPPYLFNQAIEWYTPFYPAEKFLIAISKSQQGHPLNTALLRTLAWWWCAANFSAEWFLNFAQIFGQPIRWANYDPSLQPADREILEGMLSNMGSSAWAMFPAGTQLNLVEALKGGTDNPQHALLQAADTVCDILILRQTLTTEVGSTGGNRALGEVHQDVLSGVKISVANWAASVLNDQLLPAICRLTYGNDLECPWLQPGLPKEEDPLKVADFLFAANRLVAISKTQAYEKLGLVAPGPDDEIIPAQRGGGEADSSPVLDATAAAGGKRIQASAADSVADVLGIKRAWLAPLRAFFTALEAKIAAGELSDQAALAAIEEMIRTKLPELAGSLNTEVLADWLDQGMTRAAREATP